MAAKFNTVVSLVNGVCKRWNEEARWQGRAGERKPGADEITKKGLALCETA